MHAVLIDDHELFRSGLRQVLEDVLDCRQVSDAASLDEGLELLASMPVPDLIITDLNMPGSSGPESVRALVEAFPDARIVVMSSSDAPEDVIACISAGVDGYIPKSLPAAEMIAAIRQVMGGAVYMPRAARRGAQPEVRPVRPAVSGVDHLTARQREVLDQLLLGQASKEIARTLDIAEGTVKIHLAAIYRALGVKSRAEAIARLAARA